VYKWNWNAVAKTPIVAQMIKVRTRTATPPRRMLRHTGGGRPPGVNNAANLKVRAPPLSGEMKEGATDNIASTVFNITSTVFRCFFNLCLSSQVAQDAEPNRGDMMRFHAVDILSKVRSACYITAYIRKLSLDKLPSLYKQHKNTHTPLPGGCSSHGAAPIRAAWPD
jgi:hypothetical protein